MSLHPGQSERAKQRLGKHLGEKEQEFGGTGSAGRRCRQRGACRARMEGELGEHAGPRRAVPAQSGCREKLEKPFQSKARGCAVHLGVLSAGTQPCSPPHQDPPKTSQDAGHKAASDPTVPQKPAWPAAGRLQTPPHHCSSRSSASVNLSTKNQLPGQICSWTQPRSPEACRTTAPQIKFSPPTHPSPPIPATGKRCSHTLPSLPALR